MWKWEEGLYPRWFMVKVMAWWRTKSHVHNHQEDAIAQKSKGKK